MKAPEFLSQLEYILHLNPVGLLQAQNTTFAQLTANTGTRYVLFGAGRLGQITLAGLRKAGVEPLAFADNNPGLWNSKVEGLTVLSPQSAADHYGLNAVFIITVYTNAPVWAQLKGMGLKFASFALLAWNYPQLLTPHGGIEHPNKIFDQAEDVRKALGLWEDDISRREFLELLRWFTMPSHLPQKDIYFSTELFSPLANEVFVDCGAFNGDSVREFLEHRNGVFGEIVAVEPDPTNCEAFRAWVASMPFEMQNKIFAVQSAVGSKREMVKFNATGTAGSSIGAGSFKVQCLPLDEILANTTPTFIKMDIEGAELEALLGARQVISEHTPVMAVCLYHSQEHLWQIPLMIHSFSDQYSFYLRRYSDECWETVCYAVPKKRLVYKSVEK
jgi:FkbM family methyltransferase